LPDNPTIGSLRWPVTIATREQAAAATAASAATITETLAQQQTVRADIRPIGPMTFVAGQQTDRPITHRIYIRWLDWIDMQHVILRITQRLDGTNRVETFRIRKVGEVDGRKRFLEILAELETRQ
jgi:head-tail adaptor